MIGRLGLPRLVLEFTLHDLREIVLAIFGENVAVSLRRLQAGSRVAQITMS